MWTQDGWVIPMPVGLAQDLAWSLVVLASEDGLAQVSFRSLARHTRMAPGTITNHYASKSELFGICATVVGRWLADATSDHADERGPVGLFPTPDDRTYRWLLGTWVQLRAFALTDEAVDERVHGASYLVDRVAGRVLAGDNPATQETTQETTQEAIPLSILPAALRCLEGLRAELVRPATELTAEAAWDVLRTLTVPA